MKFKAKAKDCQLSVKVKASFGEVIDDRELDRFRRVFLRGFLKPKMIKRNLVEYTGPVCISFYDRFKKPMTKREFLFVLEQLSVAVQKLRVNHFSINGLVMDMQHAYINEVTKEAQFIFIPTVSERRDKSLVDFFEAIAYSVKPADEQDTDFVSRFVYFFRAMQPFDVDKIEKFVAKEDKSVVSIIRKQNAGQSGMITDKPNRRGEEREDQNGDAPTELLTEDEDGTALLGEDEATGLLDDSKEEATGILNMNCGEEEATGLLDDDEGSEATGLLIANHAKVRYPTLFRILTKETISVNKPVFRLGKERSYVDYFITNNIAVSRGHADIITRGSKYFVKDLNSKNHTYINGQELPIHMEIEIHDGDSLKLANEEFIFNT